MSFKVGDKVICVNDKDQDYSVVPLVKDKEYVVLCFTFGGQGCIVDGAKTLANGFWCHRFRKKEPTKRKTNAVTRQLVKDFEELKEYDPQGIPTHIEQ